MTATANNLNNGSIVLVDNSNDPRVITSRYVRTYNPETSAYEYDETQVQVATTGVYNGAYSRYDNVRIVDLTPTGMTEADAVARMLASVRAAFASLREDGIYARMNVPDNWEAIAREGKNRDATGYAYFSGMTKGLKLNVNFGDLTMKDDPSDPEQASAGREADIATGDAIAKALRKAGAYVIWDRNPSYTITVGIGDADHIRSLMSSAEADKAAVRVAKKAAEDSRLALNTARYTVNDLESRLAAAKERLAQAEAAHEAATAALLDA